MKTVFKPAIKRIPTTDGVEILNRRYGNSLLRRFSLFYERKTMSKLHLMYLKWKIRRKLKKGRQECLQAFHDGYAAGKKSNEKYSYLNMPGIFDRVIQE